MSDAIADPGPRPIRRKLSDIGFLVMFMELACIRWFGTHVVFLLFFSNVVLIVAFLGMSFGCVSAGRTTPNVMASNRVHTGNRSGTSLQPVAANDVRLSNRPAAISFGISRGRIS